jgi:hypothetical protein
VLIGVDPHKASIAVAAVDEAIGELVECASFPQNLERVMNFGENPIGMRILRLTEFTAVRRFPHSQAVSDQVHNSL